MNLEELETELKALSSSYIKVSLNDSMSKLLSTYESVEKTLDNATASHKLTSGSLKENETQTFHLRLWLDEDTPPIDEVMNASFFSKVVIKAIHKEDIESDMIVSAMSLNEDFSNQEEIISFTGRSEKYNIIEYSIDNIIWNPVDTPAKEVTILQTYKEDGEYTMYFKDEVGNVIEKNVFTSKLDQVPPTINVSAIEYLDGIKIDASKSVDTKSNIASYFYQLGDDEFIESSHAVYTFSGVADGTYTVHIKIKDHAGNMSDVKDLTVVIAYEHVYVSSSGNDTTGIGSINNPFLTLQPAYNKVKSGGEILLLSDITATSTTNMDIKNKHVTLKSDNAVYSIIRGNSFASQIIDVSNYNTLTTAKLILDGNNLNANGSLIEVHKATLNLNDETTLQNNIHSGKYCKDWEANSSLGGGLYAYDSTINIQNAKITNNKLIRYASDQSNSNVPQGGGIYIHNSTLNLKEEVTISNNSVEGTYRSQGGGIKANNSVINMYNANITDNSTTSTSNDNANGGGLFLYNSILNLNDGLIARNVSTIGGGLYAGGPNCAVTIKGGKVEKNQAPNGPDFYIESDVKVSDQR